MKKIILEFKEFISRGNVIDMALGVVIGSAFGKIVSSLVDNIIMPLVGLIIGGIDFSSLAIKIKDTSIQYGLFIQNVIDFLIISLCIFTIIKIMNKFKRKTEEKQIEVKKADDILLLEEIRDLLKKKK